MKYKTRLIWIFVVIFLLFLVAILTISVNAQTYPTIKPFVNDFANVLSQQEEDNLNAICTNLEKSTSYEIVIVTVKTTEGQDRIEYANKIGEQAGVGKAAEDNGIVILWTEEDERGLAMAVGRGAESTFNDAKASRILTAQRYLFEDKQYYNGFVQILISVENELNTTTNATTNTTTNPLNDISKTTWIIIGIMILIVIIVIIIKANEDGGGSSGGIAGAVIGSSTGSSGGGGFSFGGGSFGGGGARG